MMVRSLTLRILGLALFAAGVAAVPALLARNQGGGPAMFSYTVVRSYLHDPDAFTQGLLVRGGFLYESTGQYGQSTLRKVRLDNGQVVQQHRLDKRYFGEGLTDWEGKLIQLTWREGLAFVYDLATFKPERTFAYNGEGWGLTHDGKRLIMSDGSSTLRFLHPETFRELGRITVLDRGRGVTDLNELEYVNGEIFANVWNTDRIARIAPASGQVTGWIDLAGLWPQAERGTSDAVLNGIAYDASSRRLFVTGKLWPRIYEIALVRK
jgi:glutamine cyclotransferase